MTGMDQAALLSALSEIADHGGTEQARAARELIDRLTADEPGAQAAAQQLADAYLHDPYLTRNPDDR